MTIAWRASQADGAARAGTLVTAHGEVRTPVFMPVGTAATVKAMTADAVRTTGASVVLANTYHLMLRPGADRIASLGGLHRFMDWPGPILTDSGGFQVMSLAGMRTMDEDGVTFSSHIDGTAYRLTAENSTAIQHALDATITMAFDECTPYPATEAEAASSMRRSMRWARRSREAFVARPGYGQFGIVQGGIYPGLRAESVGALAAIGFEGCAIGGLAVGEGQAAMFETLDATVPLMPQEAPRYLMGVGAPGALLGAIMRGLDMFDCVMPTRAGRTARGFVPEGTLNLRNARHAAADQPLEAGCPCPACSRHSRAYLHHLFRTGEMLGPMLLTWHNLTYYARLMAGLRDAIEDRRLAGHAAALRAGWRRGDPP